MNTLPEVHPAYSQRPPKQRGVVLFIALIALVAMSLAAVALVRSVDTSTVIAGNLAFKQSATTSADGGVESAIAWLTTTNASNGTKDPWKDATHTFNVTDATAGYYSNASSALDLYADSTWASSTSASAGTDSAGNTIRYVIQRMCKNPNQVLTDANCLFSDAKTETSSKRVKPATEAGANTTSKPPIYRITARVTGPRNTVSYIQAYAY